VWSSGRSWRVSSNLIVREAGRSKPGVLKGHPSGTPGCRLEPTEATRSAGLASKFPPMTHVITQKSATRLPVCLSPWSTVLLSRHEDQRRWFVRSPGYRSETPQTAPPISTARCDDDTQVWETLGVVVESLPNRRRRAGEK
jgi:hypothetical protein